MSSSKIAKQASTKQCHADTSPLGAVSPSVIGSRSLEHAHRPHLLCDEDDDRWPAVEELEAVAETVIWQTCRACTFQYAGYESICQICGTHNPAQSENKCTINAAQLKNVTTQSLLDEEASLSTALTENSNCPPSEGSEPSQDDEEEEEDASSEDEEFIPGTLDVPPPVGTQVKVLHDDDQWHPANVLQVRGSRARLCFVDGEHDVMVLDFNVHAVRLADYESEDECSETNEDDEREDESIEQNMSVGATIDSKDMLEGHKSYANDSDNYSNEETEEEEDSEEEDEEEEEMQIPGTLDEAPPVGTKVKVLADDDKWHAARITATKGTIAIVLFEDGDEEKIDFDEHAVRLYDYASDDVIDTQCDRVQSQEVVAECEVEPTPHSDTFKEIANAEVGNSVEFEEEKSENDEVDDVQGLADGEAPAMAPCAAVIGRSIEHAN